MSILDRLSHLLGSRPSHPAQSTAPAPAERERIDRELILYKYDACPFCRRVTRKVSALHLEDQIEFRDTRREPRWRADLVQRTGRTQVPCLFVDGEPMFESADINRWLQAHYG